LAVYVFCESADVREVEDYPVEGVLADEGAAAGGEEQAEFRGVEGIEDANCGVSEEGADVGRGLGVFLEEGGACFDGCGCEVGAGVLGQEGEGEGEVACGWFSMVGFLTGS